MSIVLVTGASKGIGRASALHLAARGHVVFAGVRNAEDGKVLHDLRPERIIPLMLDVTRQDQIDAAARAIAERAGTQGLHGLVNNAGIALAGPLEFLPVAELRRQFEVNVFGQIAVTQALLPMLRQARGRIINISSIAGRSVLPITGAYAASKHALEALTDALRVELMPWGIQVCAIEPGVIDTPIWETSIGIAEETMKTLPAAREYYGRIIDGMKRRALSGAVRGLPAERVARAIEHALFARKPRTRYVVGRDARVRLLLQKLPDRWRDRLIARRLERL